MQINLVGFSNLPTYGCSPRLWCVGIHLDLEFLHAPIDLGNPLQCEESWLRFTWSIGGRVVPDLGRPLSRAPLVDELPTHQGLEFGGLPNPETHS